MFDRAGTSRTSAARFLQGALIVAFVAAVILITWHARQVLLVIFGGFLFGILLRALSEALARRSPLGTRWSLAVILVATAGLAAMVVWLVAPEVSRQVDQLSKTLPESLAQLRRSLQESGWGEWAVNKVTEADQWLTDRRAMSRAGTVVSSTVAVIGGVLVILAVGIYTAAEPGVYRDGLVRLIPPDRRERTREVLDAAEETLRWWLIGRFAGMAVIGIGTWFGLWLLGVPLPLVLAIIAAMLTFIPNIGPVVSVIPAVLLALLQSPATALYVVLLYIGIQFVESYILTPLIQRRAAEIPPVLLLSSQLVMGVLCGLVGLALATPLLALVMVLTKKLYVEDTLEGRSGAGSPEVVS